MRIVKTQWIRLAVNVLVSWLPFSGQAATVGLLVEPINQVSSLSGNSCSWQLTHTRGYAEPSVNWANDRSYIEGMQRAEQFGQVATYFSEQWDTQVYFTRTAIPNSAGEVSLIDPDSKAVFIFVHGSGTKKSSGRNYIHNMNTLANLGFSALAFDMPFHADGPVDPKLNYSNHFMEWVRQIVLEAKKAGKPVYLAGHSFGPEVALEFVAQFPKLVDGVVALSPAGFTKELDDWYENYTTKMNFGGEVPENEKGGEWAAKMSEQFIWNKSKTADPTLVNPRLRIRILSGDREEYVPAPVGGPNNTPIGPNTYDIRPPLKQMLRNAVVTIEPGIGHYLFDFVDSEGNNVVTRELLLVAGEDPAQAKNLIDKRRKENERMLPWQILSKKYAQDAVFRSYCDLKFGPGRVLKVARQKANENSDQILRAYAEAWQKRQVEIYQKILNSKETYPAFYAKHKEAIERLNPKSVNKALFIPFMYFLAAQGE